VAITVVQRIAKGSVGAQASVTVGAADLWVTPTAGNLIVVAGSSDGTLTVSPTLTSGPSIIDDNAAYSWYGIAAGTESTITVTPNAPTDTAIVVMELAGVTASPFDVQGSQAITGVAGTSTNAAPVTTSVAGAFLVAFACLGRVANLTDPFPAGLTWSNSFTATASANTGTTSGAFPRQYVNVGELTAGAAGSYSTAASWTNAMFNRQHLILAFKPAAASSVNAPAELAAGSGTADAPQVAFTPAAPQIAGTGTAPAPVVLMRPVPPVVAGTGLAPAATAAGAPAADPVPGSGTAPDATVSTASDVAATAEVAVGSGAAFDAAPAVGMAPAEGSGSGAAPDAVVSTSASATAAAELAAGSGAAADATVALTSNPADASGSGSSPDASILVDQGAQAPAAPGSGAAGDPSISTTAAPGAATGTGVAFDAVVVVLYLADAPTAPGAGSAPPPSLAMVVPSGDGLGAGSAPSPSVVLSSGVIPFVVLESVTSMATVDQGQGAFVTAEAGAVSAVTAQ
jgi:hypothetical protein